MSFSPFGNKGEEIVHYFHRFTALDGTITKQRELCFLQWTHAIASVLSKIFAIDPNIFINANQIIDWVQYEIQETLDSGIRDEEYLETLNRILPSYRWIRPRSHIVIDKGFRPMSLARRGLPPKPLAQIRWKFPAENYVGIFKKKRQLIVDKTIKKTAVLFEMTARPTPDDPVVIRKIKMSEPLTIIHHECKIVLANNDIENIINTDPTMWDETIKQTLIVTIIHYLKELLKFEIAAPITRQTRVLKDPDKFFELYFEDRITPKTRIREWFFLWAIIDELPWMISFRDPESGNNYYLIPPDDWKSRYKIPYWYPNRDPETSKRLKVCFDTWSLEPP